MFRRFGWCFLGLACGMMLLNQVAQASDEGITSGYIDNRGVALHYRAAGSGPTLLFLHGFPLFSYMWDPQLLDLSDSFRAVAIDGRGFNLSGKPENVDDYQLEILVSDVLAVADALSPDDPVVLVGHDWGGALAWRFARANPQRVSHLIVANAPPPELLRYLLRTDPQQQASSAYLEKLMSPGAEDVLAANDYAILRGLHTEIQKSGATTGADIARYTEAWSQPAALRGMLNWYRANLRGTQVQDSSLKAAIESVQVRPPTLVVWGDRDPVFTQRVPDFIGRHGCDVRVEHLPEAEHTPSLEQSEVFNRLLRSFIDDPQGPKAAGC
jgi:pimeloyl-ACP methyl ester carboxylesterase